MKLLIKLCIDEGRDLGDERDGNFPLEHLVPERRLDDIELTDG